jgi:alpha-ketoglutarate-dependent taurine dioxygenase
MATEILQLGLVPDQREQFRSITTTMTTQLLLTSLSSTQRPPKIVMVTTYSTGTKKNRQVWVDMIHAISTLRPTTKHPLIRLRVTHLKLP